MEIKWKEVIGTQEKKPPILDKTSSSKFVYLHRNIERVKQPDEQGGEIEVWKYEEGIVTQEEFVKYDIVVMEIVQAEIDSIARKQDRKNAEIQSNIDYLAMMTGTNMEEV